MSDQSFDLDQLDVRDKTTILEVKNLRGQIMRFPDGTPFTIELYSKDNPAYEAALTEFAKDSYERDTEAGRDPNTPDLARNREVRAHALAALTKRWRIMRGGKEAENTRAAYLNLADLLEQADKRADARVNFIKS